MLKRSASASGNSSSLSHSGSSLSRLKRESSASGQFGKARSSSLNRKNSNVETQADFIEECKCVYLAVFDSIGEDITSVEELMLLLQYAGRNPSKKTINKYWTKDTDAINFSQFSKILRIELPTQTGDLIKAFKKIDVNGDGYITHDELFNVLTMHGERMTKAEVKSLMDDADYNGDGKLDYREFCGMMSSTIDKCKDIHQENKKQKEDRETRRPSSVIKSRENRNIESESVKKLNTRPPLGKSNTSAIREIGTKQKEAVKEPSDLTRWHYTSSKGSFYTEEDGSIESHQFQLIVLEKTDIFIAIKPVKPKYGQYKKELLETDMTVFLLEGGRKSKLVAYSESKINEKFCCKTTVDAGSYQILTFSSGNNLKTEWSNPATPAKLVRGEGDNMKFTKACKESFLEIFYRCDLDGNGYVNRKEFNQFQLRTSGEGCDDDAWEVVKENFEMNNNEEITSDGFLTLNLMEAQDPDGGPDELWVSLQSMGYSKSLELVKAQPFLVEVFTKKSDSALEMFGVSNGAKPLENALLDSIRKSSSVKQLKGKKEVFLYTEETVQRTTIAVENKSNQVTRVRVNFSKCQNVLSSLENGDCVVDLEPKEMQIVQHFTPSDNTKEMKIVCDGSILR